MLAPHSSHFQLFHGLILEKHSHVLHITDFFFFFFLGHQNALFQYFIFLYLNLLFRCWMSCSESSKRPTPTTYERCRTDGKPIQRSSFMGWWKSPWSLLKLWMEVRKRKSYSADYRQNMIFCPDIVANPVFDLHPQFLVPSTRWKPTPLTSYFWTYQ